MTDIFSKLKNEEFETDADFIALAKDPKIRTGGVCGFVLLMSKAGVSLSLALALILLSYRRFLLQRMMLSGVQSCIHHISLM